MGTEVMGKYIEANVKEGQLTWLQQWALLSAHPRCIFFRSVALIWLCYFLWQRDWATALFSTVLIYTVGMLSVRDINLEALRTTTLGKIALLHLHPGNMTIQLVGLVPAFYGLWSHSLEYFLSGLSVVFLGHIFGWDKVDSRFSLSTT